MTGPSCHDLLLQLARPDLAGLLVLIVLTLVLGVAYPLAVTAYAAVLGDQADRQLLAVDGEVVGLAPDRAGVRRATAGSAPARRRRATATTPSPAAARTWGRTTRPARRRRGTARRGRRARGGRPGRRAARRRSPPPASGLDPDISPEYARSRSTGSRGARPDPAEVRSWWTSTRRAAPWASSASHA